VRSNIFYTTHDYGWKEQAWGGISIRAPYPPNSAGGSPSDEEVMRDDLNTVRRLDEEWRHSDAFELFYWIREREDVVALGRWRFQSSKIAVEAWIISACWTPLARTIVFGQIRETSHEWVCVELNRRMRRAKKGAIE